MFREGLIANRYLDAIVERLNDSLVLRHDLTLAIGHCASEEWLPEPRRLRCPSEYARLVRSWSRLLAPHRRAH